MTVDNIKKIAGFQTGYSQVQEKDVQSKVSSDKNPENRDAVSLELSARSADVAHQEKIQNIKASVDSGTYNVSSDKVAASINDFYSRG